MGLLTFIGGGVAGEAMPFAHIIDDSLLTQNADCRLPIAMSQLLNDLSPTFQYPQVHGIIRRSSSFNTGRIDHIYKDRHTTGVKVCVEFFWKQGSQFCARAIAICNYATFH